MNKALFLDRDGVINIEKNYVHKITDFEFVEGIFELLRFFQEKDYLLIVVTNQAGIARGYYTEEDFNHLTEWMLQEFETKGIHINKVFYSPYHEEYGIGQYKKSSYCRKPSPGMLLLAQKEFDIDMNNSILIGDKESDILAGVNAGVGKNVLLCYNYSKHPDDTLANFIVTKLTDVLNIE